MRRRVAIHSLVIATGTTWLIADNVCFSYMRRGTFHVSTGGFIKKMSVEILP